GLPVVRRDQVQGGDDVAHDVGNDFGRATLATVEFAAEIVERSVAAGLPADDGVGLEPDEDAFGIEIDAATAGGAFGAGGVEQLSGCGGVGKGTPGAAILGIQRGGVVGEVGGEVGAAPESAAGGEDVSVVSGEAFVDPEQVAFHRLGVVGRGEAGGTAVFAVP